MAEVEATKRGAIILCGGASSRMGRDKAWLPFGSDEVMLQRVVRLVGEVVAFENIVCVAGADQELPPLPSGILTACDPLRHRGPLAGFATGLAAISNRADATFVIGCDVPLLVPAFVTRMFDLLGDFEITVPHDGVRYHPLAAVYRTTILPHVEAILIAGERSLVALIERCRSVSVPVDTLRDVDPKLSSLGGCNTLEEYFATLFASGFPA
jgi:molybdopterin-guanine dinucleotide biosynthesis protein A